jgi:hypothetical protein
MNTRYRITVSIAAAMLTLGVASAQSLPGAHNLSLPQRCALLLENPDLAKQLELTPTQNSGIKQALAQHTNENSKIMAAKEPPLNAYVANDKKFSDTCLKLLSQAQTEQLLVIGIHSLGTMALQDGAVDKMLGLNTLQSSKVHEILRTVSKREEDVAAMIGAAMQAVPEPKPDADRKAYDKKTAEVYASYEGERMRLRRERIEADKRVLEAMTTDQKAKWLKMAGLTAQK